MLFASHRPLDVSSLAPALVFVVTKDPELRTQVSRLARAKAVIVACSPAALPTLLGAFAATHLIVDERCAGVERVRAMVGDGATRVYAAAERDELVALARGARA